MGYAHIIALIVLTIILLALMFSYMVHSREHKVGNDKDFIEVFTEAKEKQIQDMGISFSITLYLNLMVIIPLVLGVVCFFLTTNGVYAVIVGLLGLIVPEIIIRAMASRGEKDFEEQYVKALQQLATSLKTGMNITEAVNDVANSKFIGDSVRTHFVRMSSDLQMGLTVSEAFQRFADSTTSVDAQDVALAIDVQTEVGGHEAEVVSDVAQNICDRIMLRKEVNSILAEPNMEAIIFDFLPIGVMIGFGIAEPSFMDVYFYNFGYTILLIVLFVCPLIGSYINHHSINKISKGA